MTNDHRYTCDLYFRLKNGPSLQRYIERGTPVGGFLTALLENNLKETFARADDENRATLYEYVQWLYQYAPSGCWGSPERVSDWLKAGGLEGLRAADDAA